MPTMVELILKKRRGEAFAREEIAQWVQGAARGAVPDYQLAALLMAICCQGMTPEETRDLTMEMAHSGAMADLSAVGQVCVDKHSTGGVGDTTTLVLTPLVAACGAKVAKMSGRGLGFTGGTLDKLESIPGFETELSMERFIDQVRRVGCAVIGQSQNLVPADKALYALRDVTGTVDSLPLIVSSIMSKKIAAGSGAIVLDVKTGSGALMHSLTDSIALAQAMVEVGRLADRPTAALVTGMDQPLGTHIGNALEVKEAIDILSGRAGGRLLEVSLRLGSLMLTLGGYAKDEAEARARLEGALQSGRGLLKLKEMISAQGGDPRVCDDVTLLPRARRISPVPAQADGVVAAMDTALLGEASQVLGAGRIRKEDVIDPAVGIVMAAELGNRVEKGAPLAYLHSGGEDREALSREETAARMVQRAVTLTRTPAPLPPLVYAAVRPEGVERF